MKSCGFNNMRKLAITFTLSLANEEFAVLVQLQKAQSFKLGVMQEFRRRPLAL